MTKLPYEKKPYRSNVGIMVINDQGLVFIGRRIKPSDSWQMPQGGIDEGEDPQKAAFRELLEETGIEKVRLITESPQWLFYDLPPDIADQWWGGLYRGQQQKWFLMHFYGTDEDIRLTHHEAEFSHWEWATPETVQERIADFKKEIYAQVFRNFMPYFPKSDDTMNTKMNTKNLFSEGEF
jgi:putative (di)nucleoside polyphosphate hydrolase